MTADLLGYLALSFGLIAMGMKRLALLRIIHMLSAVTYIIYGALLEQTPLMLGGSLFVFIHAYHLIKMKLAKNASK